MSFVHLWDVPAHLWDVLAHAQAQGSKVLNVSSRSRSVCCLSTLPHMLARLRLTCRVGQFRMPIPYARILSAKNPMHLPYRYV
eukprot:1156421-Pelagomonas_calceolata.AAC.6